jgi:hypothetical protein
MTLMLVGTDFAKRVSALHGVDESGTLLGPEVPGAGPHGLPNNTQADGLWHFIRLGQQRNGPIPPTACNENKTTLVNAHITEGSAPTLTGYCQQG